MRACILILCVVGVAHTNILGTFRKRFNGNPNPHITDQDEEDRFRTIREIPLLTQPEDKARTNQIAAPPPQAPIDPIVPDNLPPSQNLITPIPKGQGTPIAPAVPATGQVPDFPPPVRPHIYFQTEDYLVYDRHHSRFLNLFDPEVWTLTYPGVPFPPELDVPPTWYIYSAVTVQAPKPYVDEKALRERYYTGYYYACPGNVNPFQFSWFFKNDAVNPCRWTFFQTRDDAMRYSNGKRPVTTYQ